MTKIVFFFCAGFEAYLVGGCVRDLILGKTPKDFDVVTSATLEQVGHLFICFALYKMFFEVIFLEQH